MGSPTAVKLETSTERRSSSSTSLNNIEPEAVIKPSFSLSSNSKESGVTTGMSLTGSTLTVKVTESDERPVES